jgi:hypothetical protein
MKNNPDDNEELRQFLNNNKPADDFEKEALEGFGMLSGHQEALETKKRLDSKIKDKLFKGNKVVRQWMLAAAGIALVCMLSVLMVFRQEETGDLAIKETQKEIPLVLAPPTAPEVEETPSAIREVGPRRGRSNEPAPKPEEKTAAPQLAAAETPPQPLTSGEDQLAVAADMASPAAGKQAEQADFPETKAEKDKSEDLTAYEQKAEPEKADRTARKTAAKNKRTAAAEAAPASIAAQGALFSSAPPCRYPKGDSAFVADLKTRMSRNKPVTAFTAMIVFEKNGEVKSLNLITGNLTSEQLEYIKSLIGKMKPFTCEAPSALTYTFTFSP